MRSHGVTAGVRLLSFIVLTIVAACGGGGNGGGTTTLGPSSSSTTAAVSATSSASSSTTTGVQVTSGFHVETIAQVPQARELAALPNGDLLVGTSSAAIYIVPGAESSPLPAQKFVTLPEGPAQGIAFGPNGAIYAASEYHVYKIPYSSGDRSESNPTTSIASVRTGAIAPNSDGDVHHTSSVAVSSTALYVSVGSSCNACTEVDPTRATIQQMDLNGNGMTTRAKRIRNAIAVAINPATGSLWAGGAGQDNLPYGHPYEFFDNVSSRSGVADYGWPVCEENQNPYGSGANCAGTVSPLVAVTAYSTIIGATFYSSAQSGPYLFPAQYRGGIFLAAHGSWHCCPASVPQVIYVSVAGDAPATAVNWSAPAAQWQPFLTGFGSSAKASYTGRPTGIAVGAQGSLFVGDDANSVIYRIRPN
jgi:glucose/arabinose dehydrogenase